MNEKLIFDFLNKKHDKDKKLYDVCLKEIKLYKDMSHIKDDALEEDFEDIRKSEKQILDRL